MHAEAEPLRWNLGDLYDSADDPKLESDLKTASKQAKELAERHRGKVASLPPAELATLLRAYEALMDVAYRPQLYASLLFAGATDDPKAQALINRTREATTEAL